MELLYGRRVSVINAAVLGPKPSGSSRSGQFGFCRHRLLSQKLQQAPLLETPEYAAAEVPAV